MGLIFSRNSIRQRLAFSICLQLLTVMLIFGGIAYIGARKIALELGKDRLKTLSGQLSTMVAGNAHNLFSATYTSAHHPAIKKYLMTNGKDSVEQTSKLLQALVADTLFAQVELKNSQGTTLLVSAGCRGPLNISIDSLITSASIKNDSGRLEKFFTSSNSIYYPIIVNITDHQQLIGHMVRWRRVVSSSRAIEQLSRLMGTDAGIYVGNIDGSLWTDLLNPVSSPPVNDIGKNRIIAYTSPKKNSVIGAVSPISNSKWVIAVELSRKKIFETANRFLYWLIIAGCVLLIAGFFIAWLTSRNISRPIKNLTMANSLLASGNYSSILDLNRRDELGKLAREFHAMALQVQQSREELEKKAQNYKLLFERNPMPMWIICLETLNIMDVNQAAVSHYGYSRQEFLRLNAKDLRPAEDVEKYVESIDRKSQKEYRGMWRHRKKDGTIIMVDVIADSIVYKEKAARLILANDVTEKLNAEAELVSHKVMQQKLITEAAIQVQEKEREEIGKELHDNINQILASTKLYLELALGGNLETLGNAISKSYQNVSFIIEEIRRLSKKLVPPALDATLAETIRDLVDEIGAIAPLKITLTTELDETLLNESIKLMIYRIVQEQINNILKYAAASEVEIKITTNPETLELAMVDNGVGFDPNKKSKGIGLRNIDNRVRFYNGVTHVISYPGKGCRLEISIPIQKIMNPIS